MYLEKLKEFEKEIECLCEVKNEKMEKFTSLTEFLFEYVNLNNKYNIRITRSGAGFKFQFEEAYLLFEEEGNKLKKEYLVFKNSYNSVNEIEKVIEREKYIAELFDLIDIKVMKKLKEYNKFLSKEREIIEEKINERYCKIRKEENEYIKNLIKKMFSGKSDVKKMLELIERNEEDTPCISFYSEGDYINFRVSSFNIEKKGNKRNYFVNGKRSSRLYMKKCLMSEFYYRNKKMVDFEEFKKLSFFKNLRTIVKDKNYESNIKALFENMSSYINVLENKEKIEDF